MYTFEYDEMGGYDCMTPAYIIKDDEGNMVAEIDLRHYGYSDCGLGSSLTEHREAVRRKALDIAKKIIYALNK